MKHLPELYGLQQIPAPVHPRFEAMLGYEGHRRHVAFYWMPAGDELVYVDGEISADGNYQPWLMWRRHLSVRLLVAPYDFGSSDSMAKHWLLLDRHTRRLYAGKVADVVRFLDQAPDLRRRREQYEQLSQAERDELHRRFAEDFQRFVEEAAEHINDVQIMIRMRELAEQMRKDLDELEGWLSQQLVTCGSCGRSMQASHFEKLTCPICGGIVFGPRMSLN